jgi:hypothetical protein
MCIDFSEEHSVSIFTVKCKPSNEQRGLCLLLASYWSLAWLTLKMEAVRSSETSENFAQISQCYSPEVRELFNI